MLLFLLLCNLCPNVYAMQDASILGEEETMSAGKTVLDVLTEVANEQNFQELLFSDEAVTEDLKDYSVANKPVLLAFPIFEIPSTDDAEESIRKMWDEELYDQIYITVVETDVSLEGVSSFRHLPSYVLTPGLADTTRKRDSVKFQLYTEFALNGSAVQQFCGNQYNIEYLMFLGRGDYYQPTFAVYFTDGGVFVRICGVTPEYREYTWKDFAEYYLAYVEYTSKQYDELYGSASGGGGSFIDFIDNIYPTLGEDNTQRMPEKPSYTWAFIVGTCLLVCCVATVVIIRKRKLSVPAQDEQLKG